MSSTVFIVDKDQKLIETLSQSLSARGFLVEETSNAKNAIDLIRRRQPSCVVLAVDLDQGQNGYILCKNLKRDDDTKNVPVVIIGDPKGFAQHQKLKTRAEDYVGKPLEPSELVERVGALIGFPEINVSSRSSSEILIEEQFSEQASTNDTQSEAIEVESDEPSRGFEDVAEESEERTVIGFYPSESKIEPAAARPSFLGSSPSSIERGESRELRARVGELEAALIDANERNAALEEQNRELDARFETQSTELEAAKAGGGRSDKDHFALKELLNKRDKELLKIKNELNEKDQELVELRERETALEQAASQSSEEIVRRDAQVKTLQAKTEQLTQDKKRVDSQLLQVKEEARSSSSKLAALQTDFDAVNLRSSQLEAEMSPAIDARHAAEAARDQAETVLAELRGEHEATRSQLDERTTEADELRSQLESLSSEQEQLRNELSAQSSNYEDQLSTLRSSLVDVQMESKRHEERHGKLQLRVKRHLELFERQKSSLKQALEMLDEPVGEEEEIELDELS